MSLSIRWRLTLWIAIALVLTLTAIFLSLRFALNRILTDDLDDELSRDLGQVSAQLAIVGSLDEEALASVIETAGFTTVIRDTEGHVLAASPGLEQGPLDLNADQLREIVEGSKTVTRTVEVGGEDVRMRSARLLLGREVAGIIQVGESAETIGQVMGALTVIFITEGVGVAVLALAAGYWLSRSALKPVEGITALAAEIEASDLTRRIDAAGKPDEVQRLADTFDAMLARLDAAFRQQRDFVMDVSHELRTPLTVLRGNLDVLLMDERLDSETRTQFEKMSAEVGRLIRLTSNLLYMAHADAGRRLDRRPVELDALCLELLSYSKDLRQDVTLRMGHQEEVVVMGDRDLLKQMVLNLVDNGLKYSQVGGQVTLSLYRGETDARVVVEDTGPGIPPDQQSQIFERFHRGPDSNVRAPGGAGIGLAISRWIARAHGGDILVRSEVGQGSTFTVVLPLEPVRADSSKPEERGDSLA
ncbi:MAG: ATP-binding protein [Dehalococcoidia bacterium]